MSEPAKALQALHRNLCSVIVDKQQEINALIIALLARGHILLEDVPGTGKTVLAKTLAKSIQGRFTRLQCTPDLMPSDVTGVSVYRQDEHRFDFHPGPVFSDVLLADEVNRATPRAQSCLLECMEERQVSVDGESHRLPDNFFVIATQNPVGFRGTYPLPEAQLDRFLMRLRLGYPGAEHEAEILSSRMLGDPVDEIEAAMDQSVLSQLQDLVKKIEIKPEVLRYITDIVRATREHHEISLGASPRGAVSLMRASQAVAMISGKRYVSPDHVKRIAVRVLAHRLILKHASDSAEAEALMAEILNTVRVPVQSAA